MLGQHSGIGYELVLALDVAVLLMVEQPVGALAFLEEAEAQDLVEYMELVRARFHKSPALLERMQEVVRRRQVLHQKGRGRKKKKRKKRKLPKCSSPRSFPARPVRTRGNLDIFPVVPAGVRCLGFACRVLDYWIFGDGFYDVSVFYAQLGPILDTRTCVSLRDIWVVFLRPVVSGSRLFDAAAAAGSSRPDRLTEVRPQERVQRHTVDQVIAAPMLDVLVLQMEEQLLLKVFRPHDRPVPEQVVEVPKILLDDVPVRTAVRDTQLAEQLVEVPTIKSLSSLQRIMEQHVAIPVPDRGGRNAGLQGFPPEQSSTATLSSEERISERIVEQIVDIPGGGLKVFAQVRGHLHHPHLQLVFMKTQMSLVKGFSHFSPWEKSAEVAGQVSAHLPRHVSSWTPAACVQPRRSEEAARCTDTASDTGAVGLASRAHRRLLPGEEEEAEEEEEEEGSSRRSSSSFPSCSRCSVLEIWTYSCPLSLAVSSLPEEYRRNVRVASGR